MVDNNLEIITSDAGNFSALLQQARLQAREAADAVPLDLAAQPLLNGAPYKAFRETVPLSQRRNEGTFFSGSAVAATLVDLLLPKLPPGAMVVDPTSGMGDLLLAYAERLPVRETLASTLELWGASLAGIELRADLIEMTKARLIVLARVRGGFSEALSMAENVFPMIKVGDLFACDSLIGLADGFLFNPPFGRTAVHEVDGWSSGQTNAAALYLDKLVRTKNRAAPIAAVLPEVLRCGTRYSRFRNHLSGMGLSGSYFSLGRFDAWADVDVFATLLAHETDGQLWTSEQSTAERETINDFMEVRVGPVVPHRHKKTGPWRRFICAKTVPAWAEGFRPQRSRRFLGTVFKPPFVVVRRTSSPSDKQRAVASIICGDELIAVENHLIVLIPRDGSLDTCKKAYATLAQSATSDHLNKRIRCRHLTTGAVADIPWTSSID